MQCASGLSASQKHVPQCFGESHRNVETSSLGSCKHDQYLQSRSPFDISHSWEFECARVNNSISLLPLPPPYNSHRCSMILLVPSALVHYVEPLIISNIASGPKWHACFTAKINTDLRHVQEKESNCRVRNLHQNRNFAAMNITTKLFKGNCYKIYNVETCWKAWN